MATQFADATSETFKLNRENADRIVEKIEELIREGNVRRVLVKDSHGTTIIEVPLTIGIVGVALVPVWAAIAAIAALAGDFTIEVERRSESDAAGPASGDLP